MNDASSQTKRLSAKSRILLICFIIGSASIYYFSNPNPQNYYDYTFRVAENLLSGRIGFEEKPPSWLNEFVPFDNYFYSVFPLGSVLTMLPFAALKTVGVFSAMPAALIAALIAGGIGTFTLLIAAQYEYSWRKRILLSTGILFGSWMWTNLTMAGAWQLALGWAMVGEFGAIYFTVYNRQPLLAGLFFALAFGNRTEVLLTAPIFMFLLARDAFQHNDLETMTENSPLKKDNPPLVKQLPRLAWFCLAPFMLGAATLFYNYLRFDSLTDFGYARIPGVLNEPWYQHGIFSFYYIPQNFAEMLYTPWRIVAGFPFLVPTGFGGSIWWSSPFILLSLWFGARNKTLKYTAWTAIFILTLLLWIHGNPGGWQFSYRYAMTLLPWLFVILLENGAKKITWLEIFAYGWSFAANAFATYLFHWTEYVKP